MFEYTHHEAETRRLMSEAVKKVRNDTHWSTREATRIIIARTFIACSAYSLPADRVAEIGCAITGATRNELLDARVRDELRYMVREKSLRSRRMAGRTIYEVNY